MPRESKRKKQFVKALYNPHVDFVINKAVLLKHLNLILQTPWVGSRFSEDEPKKLTDYFLNTRSSGLYFVNGDHVRLNLNKMVMNWIINIQIILCCQPDNLHGEVIGLAIDKLIILLKDLHDSLVLEKDNLETQDIWLEIENSLKKTFTNMNKERFLEEIINASIIDLVSLRLNVFHAFRKDFKGFIVEDVYDYRHKHINFTRSSNKNLDFLNAILLGTTKFFNLIYKDHQVVANHFQYLPGQLKNEQFNTIKSRTVHRAHNLNDLFVPLVALFLAFVFQVVIGGKVAFALTSVCWTVLFLGYLGHMQNNRDAKPEYLIQSETDYFVKHDAALERIYDCINLQSVKIRYLAKNTKVIFFQSKPQQKSDSSDQSKLPEENKLKSKAVKKSDSVKSENKSTLIKEINSHKRLHSIDWKDQHFPRFSKSCTEDPTKPFPVSIGGIPQGRIFCMFSAKVMKELQDRGVNNLMEVASHSASSKGEQGIVKSKNFYATEDGIFEAVAKVKFLGSRGFAGAKGDIRIFMREATQGPDGEKLWIGDGFQSDHQFSNS